MRIGNLLGRLAMFTEAGAVDVEKASGGRFGPEAQSVYEVWDEFAGWAAQADLSGAAPFDRPTWARRRRPRRRCSRSGLNYVEHAAESNFAVPDTFPPDVHQVPDVVVGSGHHRGHPDRAAMSTGRSSSSR